MKYIYHDEKNFKQFTSYQHQLILFDNELLYTPCFFYRYKNNNTELHWYVTDIYTDENIDLNIDFQSAWLSDIYIQKVLFMYRLNKCYYLLIFFCPSIGNWDLTKSSIRKEHLSLINEQNIYLIYNNNITSYTNLELLKLISNCHLVKLNNIIINKLYLLYYINQFYKYINKFFSWLEQKNKCLTIMTYENFTQRKINTNQAEDIELMKIY